MASGARHGTGTEGMVRPDELDRARQSCAEGESLLAAGNRTEAARAFRVALTCTGPGSRGDEVPARGTGPDGTSPEQGTAAAVLAARARVGLGRTLLRASEPTRAEDEFRRAARLCPKDPDALHWLGCAAAHQQAYPTAERRFTRALALRPGHGPSLVQRAYVRVRLGRHTDALTDLRSADHACALDAEARWVLATLAGGTPHEVARLLGTAARAAMAGARESGHQGSSAAATDGWLRSAALLDRARRLAPGDSGSAVAHAVALCRSGRRDEGLAVLTAVSRAAPADRRVAHTLAVMAWHGHRASEGTDPDRAWERPLTLWAGLLHDPDFWRWRRAEAAARYGIPVDDTAITTLRTDLRTRLEALLPEAHRGDLPEPEVVLHRESEAARLLAEAGGVPLPDSAAPLVCGPSRIVELGREKELAAVVAASGEAAPALRRAFSHLGYAQALLCLGRPREALAALPGLRCPDCHARDTHGDHGAPHPARGRSDRAVVCAADCPRFDARNPAYAGSPGKDEVLMRDARACALEARLALGRSALAAGSLDVRGATECWRRALAHGRALDRYASVQDTIARTALGAAKALHRAGDIGAACDTLEAAHTVLGDGRHDRLKGQLARVLADRGISRANRDPERLDAPAADLRRAVELNPHLLRAQVNLGVVLRVLAIRSRYSGSLVGARDRLQEAADRLTVALAHFPDDLELTGLRDQVTTELALVRAELTQGRIGGLPR